MLAFGEPRVFFATEALVDDIELGGKAWLIKLPNTHQLRRLTFGKTAQIFDIVRCWAAIAQYKE
ncbi:hypothetical protein QD460_31010 [Rhizobium jaguaris]|uniref:Uncharacterized protein n=1 Tax=Rhizobium jaguaris TaxID=1312183 RepID=A0A387FVK6_9HYPH|nr:hypothetical protein [Rhizobium jaguaris]AYG62433.1 hypothetical protein CCGE525_27010 [Rhizobium jaguaris]